MKDLNLTFERPFMAMECYSCMAVGLDYQKLITTSEGVKSFLTRTEAPFGDAGYKTVMEPMEYLYSDGVFGTNFENRSLVDI